jgi:type 1 glutamine amidotransferase
MIKLLSLFLLLAFLHSSRADVLIVADEFPAMEVIAAKLKGEENIQSTLVWQTNLPPSLASFQAVIVYIHKDLSPKAERAFIDYAEGGGRLVLLHHSISSGKRKNKDWFNFLGIKLLETAVENGGYKWIEGVTWSVVNLNPDHFITTHKVAYPEKISYRGQQFPGFTLQESEVYLNHTHTQPRAATLLGFNYKDKDGHTWMQNTAGWTRQTGKGWMVYLMPGHTKHDFETSAYGQIVVNAVIWKPAK